MTYNPKKQPPQNGSYSSDYLFNKWSNNVPQVSALMAQGVSQYRRDIMANEVAHGLYREGNGPVFNESGTTSNSIVLGSNGIKKMAQALGPGGGGDYMGAGFGFTGSGNAVKQIPEVYSPLWLTSNLNLPRDRATINAWCRAYFALNPWVHNAIQLHSTYPISKLNIKCKDSKVKQFFDDLIEEIDLMSVCIQIAQEYWLLGEAFPYAEWNPSKAKWSRIILQNPDYMAVKRTVLQDAPIIMLRPDENLKNVVKSNRPSDIEQRKQLSQHIIDAVRRGENIQLPNFNISHIARKIAPYEIRGTGLPVCIFRHLMLLDKIYETKYVMADQMINPLTLVKIGTDSPEGLHPTHADLEAWRQVFEAAEFDPDFKIFTHPGVSVERVGFNGHVLDTSADITQLIKNITIGLQVPPVVLGDSADITYANGSVSLEALRQRYMSFRNLIGLWLKRKIFAPVSAAQEFFERVDGKKQLIVPDVEWNHMNLFDTNDFISNLIQLSNAIPPAQEGQPAQQPKISLCTVWRSLGIDPDEENLKLRKELLQQAIYRKENEALMDLDLDELRALDPSDEIPSPKHERGEDQKKGEQPVPGEAGGMPDLGLGASPGGGGPGALPGLSAPGPETPPAGPTGGAAPAPEAPPAPPTP